MGKVVYIEDYLGITDCVHLHSLDDPPDVFLDLDLLEEEEIKALRANKIEQAKVFTELAKQIRPDKS